MAEFLLLVIQTQSGFLAVFETEDVKGKERSTDGLVGKGVGAPVACHTHLWNRLGSFSVKCGYRTEVILGVINVEFYLLVPRNIDCNRKRAAPIPRLVIISA